MEEEKEKKELSRGVIVDFDFAVLDGASLLFEAASKVLGKAGVTLDAKLEALHLTGGNYQGGIAELLEKTGKEGVDVAACAHELADEFRAALGKSLADTGVSEGVKAFVRAIAAKDAKVVLDSRIDLEALKGALGDLVGDSVIPYAETSVTYGGGKWDAWKRAARATGLVDVLTSVVAGSGHGVKAALIAGFSAVAVIHPHVAYQDFGGADVVLKKFDEAAAASVLRLLRISAD